MECLVQVPVFNLQQILYMGKNGDSFTLYDDHSVWLGELGSDESDDDFHLLNVSSYNDLSSVYFDGQLKGRV